MTTPVDCSLYVDGQWVADGSGPDDADPVALSGLAITWGRATTVDQVEPSSATFELLDPPGGNSFLDLLYVGAQVDVHATGAQPAPATLPINEDPSFEAAAVGSVPDWLYNTGSHGLIVGDRAATGGHSARLYGTGNAQGGPLARIPPAPFDPLDAAAWDDIPRMQLGELWSATVQVQVPVGGFYQMQLVAFPTPAPGGGGGFGPYVSAVDTDPTVIAWRPFTMPQVPVPASVAGQWLGMYVSAGPARWESINPTTEVDGKWVSNQVTWADAAGTWDDWNAVYLDDLQLLAPQSADVVHREVLVFSGRITDLDAGFDRDRGGVLCSVIASDFTADLGNRDVADIPWPAETIAARFAHIIAAAGVDVRYTLAPTLSGYVVSWMDVDRQQCWPLLADLATSVDGVLWSATHLTTGPYLWLADPRTQSALYVLQLGDDGLVHVVPTSAATSAIELDSCDVLLDPVTFRQTGSDVSTRVAVSWQDQTVDDNGQPAPTERTETLIDAAAEVQLGTRRVAVSTLLTSAADAAAVGALILGRLRLASWRAGGLRWRTDVTGPDPGDQMNGAQVGRVLDLLDGTRRLGAALLVTNLPDWSPSGSTLPLLLQGGAYTYEQGQWTLDLTTSSAAAQGSSLDWSEVDPGWAWNEFDPAVAWSDLVGVAG